MKGTRGPEPLLGFSREAKGGEGAASEFPCAYLVVRILGDSELQEWFPSCLVPDLGVMGAEEYCLSLTASLGTCSWSISLD